MAASLDSKNVNRFVRVPEFGITVGVVLAGGVALLTLFYIYLSKKYDGDFLFFAAATAASGQLAAAFYAARVLQYTVESQSSASTNELKKSTKGDSRYLVERAERFAERWNDATMFHVRQHCHELIENRNNEDFIKEKMQSDRVFGANLKHILNFLEEMAICVNGGRCDEIIAKSFFAGIVVNVWHATHFLCEISGRSVAALKFGVS